MENTNKLGLDRRSVLKAAAWSAPAVAVAVATPLVSASPTNNSDLVPSLSGLLNLELTALGLTVATISTPDTLTVNNTGATASPAGATAQVQYNGSLLTLNITDARVTVAGSDGNILLTLPSIPAGGSISIGLGTTLDSLLDLNLLQQILGGGPSVMTATVAGDAVADNNVATSPIGISLL